MEKNTIILGGHWGNGIRVFKSEFHLTMQYGYVNPDGSMKFNWELKDISKEDAVKLATLLLATQLDWSDLAEDDCD